MSYKTLNEIGDIRGKKIFVRADFNVPIKDGKVLEDYRIKKTLPTIKFLSERGAKIMLVSHIESGGDTLRPVFERLKENVPAVFCEDCLEKGAEELGKLPEGGVLLCENIRLYDGEKKNDESFAKKLAALADIYVNDAFAVAHRKHASVVGVPKFLPKYIGFQFEEEVKRLSECFNPEHPFLFVLGGIKFDTKLPLVEKFLNIADTIFVGGALSNDLFKAKSWNVGKSAISDTPIDAQKYLSNAKILIPIDVTVEANGNISEKDPSEVANEDAIADSGTRTLEMLQPLIANAKQILWNGPLGNYEKGFTKATYAVAKMIAESGAKSIVGGGDTLASISTLGIQDKISFISTGGGAMLDFLANGTVPGLEALQNN